MRFKLLCTTFLLFFSGLCMLPQAAWANDPAEKDQERPLTEILAEISEKYQVFFTYDQSLLKNVLVNYELSETAAVETVINTLLADTHLRYQHLGSNYYVIFQANKQGQRSIKKFERKIDQLEKLEKREGINIQYRQQDIAQQLNSVARSAQAQLLATITGTIKGTDGTPLVGATVLAKGTSQGALTDDQGKFTLSVPDGVTTLVVSYIGFETQEVDIAGKTTINIVMSEAASTLDEVVVVGYGTQKKVNLTGAVSSITSEALEKRPIASVGMGLQGLIPNLNISIRNGDPTRGADFNIRGFESINGGSPLILVDGVPMDIERINPNDIASVNVLKDASAAAVYGARAAFGVILIETKKGKEGKVRIQLSTELSAAKPIFNMDPVSDPYEFVLARNRASIRTNGNPSYEDVFVNAVKAYSEGTGPEWGVVDGVLQYYGYNDYQNKVMTDFAPQQRYDLNVSGATDKSSFYVSLGMLNKDGYLRHENNENFKRYNGLIKAEFQVKEWLSLDEKVIFNSQVSDKPHFYNWDVNINTVARVNPIMPVAFPDLPFYLTPGDRGEFEQYIGMGFQNTNFLPYLEQGGRETFARNDLWLTQGATLTPLKGLRIRGEFSYNTYQNNFQDVASRINVLENQDLTGLIVGNGFSGDDYITNRSDYNQYYVMNTYAEYTADQLTNHFFKFMVGFNQEWGLNQHQQSTARSLITPLVPNLNATTGAQQTFGGKSDLALRGVFYRFNYIFKDKYLFEANGRYDGTSRFPKESRFGFFPSFSAGWRISEENFMAGTRGLIDNLKVRASYGELGNQLLNDRYPYISTMGIGTSPFMMSAGQRTPFVSAAGLVSPTLTWETVVSQNIGLDLTLLNQRLDASFDIYTRETKDMLLGVSLPAILGTGAPRSNGADLKTSGWESSITWRDRIGKDWKYRITLALSDWQTEITKYENPSGALNTYYVGQKIGEIWGYETVGIFQTAEEVTASADQSRLGANWRPGDVHYADLNNDGIISPGAGTLEDPGDRKIIGNATPRYNFGVNADLKYKNWSLTTFFQGVGKRDYWPSDGNWTWFFPFNAGHVENYYITDTWTEENRDAYFPAAHISTNTKQNVQRQSRYLQNAAYVRLKNITLAYDFAPALLNKIGLGGIQIYASGMNLWEYSPIRKPLDPEQLHTNILSGQNFNGAFEYPIQRIISGGANITF